MSILIRFLRRYWLYFVPILLLLIFIGSIWDRNYYFGGDLLFPINPQDSIIRSIYLWGEQNGGTTFFGYVLFLWQGFFYVLSLVHIPIDIIIKIFIVTIYILGFIFSYLLYRVLFKETTWGTKKFALFFALFFLLNPAAILVVVGTWQLYGFPICLFFLVKYLDTKKILYIIPFSFFLNISFFPDIPSGKYLIVFVTAVFFLLLIYTSLRNVKIKSLVLPMFLLVVISFLLNAFILVPFVNDAFGEKAVYQNYTSAVITYNGDADLYSAAIPFTTRFYNSNLVDKNSDLGHFLANPFFISWTFFLVFIALLSVFFTQDKKEKKLVYISLLAFLFLIFIAKGANPPFGDIYRWSLSHIPIAKLFRTTSTSIIGAVIFYTLLVTISIYYISKRWKVVFPIIVIVHVIMLHAIYLGYKLQIPPEYKIYQKGLSIPNEYFKMGDLLDKIKESGKILILPFNDGYITKNWGYNGQALLPWLTKKPVIANNINIANDVNMLTRDDFCSIASLYNISNFIREKDTISTGTEIKKNIEFPGDKITENQYFQLYKTNDSCFLSQLFIPQDIIYFEGHIKNITQLSYLPIYKKDSLIFTNDDSIKSTRKQREDEKQLITKANHIVIDASSSVDSQIPKTGYLHLILGEDHLIGNIIYPYVSISPGSLFYPFILSKEEEQLKNEKLKKRKLLDLQLFFASKRINEINHWGVGNMSWQISQKLFKGMMENAIQTAANSENNRDNLELVYEYTQGFRETIREDIKTSSFWNKEKINSWTTIFNNLETEIKRLYIVQDYDNLLYNFNVSTQGTYNGYLLLNKGKLPIDNSIKINVLFNNNQIATYSAREIENKRVVDLGLLNISSLKNTMTVQITNRENLIDSSKWNTVEQMESVTIDSGGLLFSPNLKVAPQGVYSNPIVSQEIKNWIPGATYLLRIRHREQNGATLHMRIKEKIQLYDKNSDSWHVGEVNITDEDLNTKVNSDDFTMLIRADKDATGASLVLFGENGMVKVESVELEKIILPEILLVNSKTDQPNNSIEKPRINFTKVNPTKYIVTLDQVKTPTFLVFSEAFDQGWKIYGRGNTYLPEAQHFLVNGYANAWSINPQDASKNDSNELVIEYVPQRLFYVGGVVSIISLFGCILYSLYTHYNKKRYNKLQNR